MVLATHAVTGALIGAIGSENLPFVIGAGFLSHFLFDTIPHWDYKLGATKKDEEKPLETDMNIRSMHFYLDLLKIGLDASIGLTIVGLLVISKPNQVILGAFIGAISAMIPDPLQFVYWKLRPRLMEPLQRFHHYMHAATRLNNRPVIGITSQIGLILIIALLFNFIY
jgi:hypothetical protein